MFANRPYKKIAKNCSPGLAQQSIECYRLYDADMPEYAVAVDCYGEWVHVAEYAAPASINEDAAALRLQEVMSAIPVALGIDSQRVVLKQRARQRSKDQYQKFDRRAEFSRCARERRAAAGESHRLS